MISKQLMQNYRYNLKEIESINFQLERLYKQQEKLRELVVHDSVQASNPDYPYNLQHHSIEGLSDDGDKNENYEIRKRIIRLHNLQKELIKSTLAVVDYINGLDDEEVKSIITYRVLGGHSWRTVAKKMGPGYTDEAVRQVYSRHFKGKSSKV